MTQDLESIALQLVDLSISAGQAIMKVYRQEDLGIEKKIDNSPLTLADKAANKIICDGLLKINPIIPILSEENDIPDYAIRKSWSTCWIIDPLDGTKEFIKRNGEFTTNIALVKNGIPILGVVHAPNFGRTYWAAKGFGAHEIYKGASTSIHANSYRFDDEGLKIACSRSHMNPSIKAYIAQFQNPDLLRLGSSLKMMYIAEGKADLYPKIGPISEWDVAASHIILEEAGGRITTLEDGEEIFYNKQNILMPSFLAEAKRQS